MPSTSPFPHPTSTLPFWRTDLHRLDDHRSTEHLPAECDVLIMGAGYAGVTTAYHLLDGNSSPPSIVILEARQACSGATARNGEPPWPHPKYLRRIVTEMKCFIRWAYQTRNILRYASLYREIWPQNGDRNVQLRNITCPNDQRSG